MKSLLLKANVKIWHLNFDLGDLTVHDRGFQTATLDKKILKLEPRPCKHQWSILMSFSSELNEYQVTVLPRKMNSLEIENS